MNNRRVLFLIVASVCFYLLVFIPYPRVPLFSFGDGSGYKMIAMEIAKGNLQDNLWMSSAPYSYLLSVFYRFGGDSEYTKFAILIFNKV